MQKNWSDAVLTASLQFFVFQSVYQQIFLIYKILNCDVCLTA